MRSCLFNIYFIYKVVQIHSSICSTTYCVGKIYCVGVRCSEGKRGKVVVMVVVMMVVTVMMMVMVMMMMMMMMMVMMMMVIIIMIIVMLITIICS